MVRKCVCIKKRFLKVFSKPLLLILLCLKFLYSKKQSESLFNSTIFTFFVIMSVFTFNFINFISKNIIKILSLLMVSFSFLLILITSFSIGTVKTMYFSVFSPKQVNCLLHSSANFFMIK